jgi:hypothetical protein
MLEGKVKWLREKEGKKPGSILFEGDQQFYTCWDTKHKQKGDKILYNITKKGEYQGKPQITIEISDEVPSTDVNGDVQPELKLDPVSHKDFTNESIENQVLIKVVGGIVERSIQARKDDEIIVIKTLVHETTDEILKAFKTIQDRNKEKSAICINCGRFPICDLDKDAIDCNQFVDANVEAF